MTDRFKFRIWGKSEESYFTQDDFTIYLEPNAKLQIIGTGLDGEDCFFETKNAVIEQCTGIKDKNGKLIYEGDIVREISKKEPEWEEYVTEVKWKVCGFNIYDTADFYFEVIGNIHENKELLDE